GRFEYRNKGYDLTLEALARLNWKMKEAGIDKTIVMFLVTKRPYSSINPEVMQSIALLEKIRETTEAIQKQIGERLFIDASNNNFNKFPDLNEYVDDYWKIRLRRNLQTWQSQGLPKVVTHNLYDDGGDDVLNFLRSSNLVNKPDDKVKVVYHPDFLSSVSPILTIDYPDFVRGCHLGVFPSYYEPWGYTPLECIASGVPTVTSDYAGFGDYIMKAFPNPSQFGVYVVNRRTQSFDEAANQLANMMFDFVKMERLDRITQRYEAENGASHFDWKNLTKHYNYSYDLALKR
ncbi:MAG: glycosyltransferase, partial [Bacteroidota bacterium]